MFCVIQGVCADGGGPAGDLAGRGYEQTTRTAHLIRGSLHVRLGYVHLLSSQDGGKQSNRQINKTKNLILNHHEA